MRELRHLSANEVSEAMPPLEERLKLAETTMLALGVDAELPPKIGVHPRPTGSLAHAMPALMRGLSIDGSADLIGAKWIAGFPENPARGLPTYHALVLLNDPLTGEPVAVMDASAITAQRTAAISGVAIPAVLAARAGSADAGSADAGSADASPAAPPARIAILGAGVQARAHLPVLALLAPGAALTVTDTDSERAAALAAEAASTPGIGSAATVPSVREAVSGASVVISVVSFGPNRQTLDPSWLTDEALFVAVDYDMQAPAQLARDARFVVDDRAQFLATRNASTFRDYPDPDATIGEMIRDESGRAKTGRVLVSHLGVGLADVVFADAILRRARDLGLGRVLPR
jgi:ornithine cyclodeaminase/alanine dehydrogenase-like protein (mu-crystallin family)